MFLCPFKASGILEREVFSLVLLAHFTPFEIYGDIFYFHLHKCFGPVEGLQEQL